LSIIEINMSFIKKRIPFYYLFAVLIASVTTIVFLLVNPVRTIQKVKVTDNNSLHYITKKDFQLVKPLLMVDLANEDASYSVLKSSIITFLDGVKTGGKLRSASVYMKELNNGKWFGVNTEEVYSMGSIMKIMTMITYLKQSETDPGLLNKKIKFEKHFSEAPVQTIVAKPIKEGNEYTIAQLMEAMIIDSDNDATVLLNHNVNFDIYFKLLKSLDLAVPKMYQSDYDLNPMQCSRLVRVLYNSTFLQAEKSEFALRLLSKSKFQNGITRELPKDLIVAHKFGERNNESGSQLHETAIIFYDDTPYALTVMTKGTDQAELSNVLSSVSKMVYDFVKEHS
jgi:beta-lactamase class A